MIARHACIALLYFSAVLPSAAVAGSVRLPNTILPVFNTAAYCTELAESAGDKAVDAACLKEEHEDLAKLETIRIPPQTLLQCLHYVRSLALGSVDGHRSYSIFYACVVNDEKTDDE